MYHVRRSETKGEFLIKLAQNDNEIADCFHVMKQLRTELEEASFVPLVRELMSDGYQLAYLRDETQVVCVAGFKISKNLFFGKHLYVEDLSTLDSERSKSYGKQTMVWLRNLAAAEGCSAIHLDSGVQRHRAHKFYLNRDMNIVCYHFAEKIT
ncbi:GCN5-related N-acetyltransferase [Methylobacter tundripaludum SV96]|uniref:GCN5-related N-acetyltransferase n=1 Tax=Methylobacter tundripaludum (strain ATCC BAA-1195 / DSM 17260 / SV96) TaxID=697282 RepID=G3IV13_METTV|nr:GCN5-related N-acetyltransferase [Methylobacter tundripaludum SV96]